MRANPGRHICVGEFPLLLVRMHLSLNQQGLRSELRGAREGGKFGLCNIDIYSRSDRA